MNRWIEETLTSHNSSRLRLKADRVLFDSETEQQKLIIFENAEFGRVMMLDGATQLATKDEFTYHEMMAHVPLFAHGHAKRALIVGGGDGGVLREALKHHELERVTLCEIDSSIIDLCCRYLPEVSAGAYDDPRTEIVIADGAKFLADTGERFDVILVELDRRDRTRRGPVHTRVLRRLSAGPEEGRHPRHPERAPLPAGTSA